MEFGQAIASCFRKYVTFRGRAPRSEYWFFVLFMFLVYFATGILDSVLMGGQTTPEKLSPLTTIAWLVFFLPSLAVLVRRVHDTGWSGWIVGGLYILLLVVGFVLGIGVGMQAEGNLAAKELYGVVGLLGLVVLAYGIFIFVLTLLKGHDGPNRYGPDPFGTGDAEVFR
ncbi:MAG: DUF805 domain-containing protein [Alphaproteobacteria bacterium]|nr:DUF805 domain-containing protein [Alphaproteobacteria bacterium]